MRQYIGTVTFAMLAVAVPVLAAALKWPWPWWAWLLIGVGLLLGSVLSYQARVRVSSSFIAGDATGSRFGNVYSDADTFVDGDARQALFWNVIHHSRDRR